MDGIKYLFENGSKIEEIKKLENEAFKFISAN